MRNLDLLIPQKQPELDQYLWATVTATSPLTIRLDGETEPLEAAPDSLLKRVTVGQRVWCQFHGRRIVILGAAGGEPDMTIPPQAVRGIATTYSGTLTHGGSTPISFTSFSGVRGGVTTSSSGLTVPADGDYLITMQVCIDYGGTSPTGFMHLYSTVNGSARQIVTRSSGWSTSLPSMFTGSHIETLSAGERVGMTVFHNTGANRSLYSASTSYPTELGVTRLPE